MTQRSATSHHANTTGSIQLWESQHHCYIIIWYIVLCILCYVLYIIHYYIIIIWYYSYMLSLLVSQISISAFLPIARSATVVFKQTHRWNEKTLSFISTPKWETAISSKLSGCLFQCWDKNPLQLESLAEKESLFRDTVASWRSAAWRRTMQIRTISWLRWSLLRFVDSLREIPYWPEDSTA